MRRFTSGTTDQYIYFVAVNSSDLITRETGLTTFTVYRARNGGTATAYTTPTIAQVSSANMPGVYSLLLDEDMTIGSGNKSEEVVLHITQASMAPVTLIYELYRPDVTEGETITVSSGAVSTVTTTTTATNVTTVNGLAAGVVTAAAIATDAITAAKIAADAVTEIQSGLMLAASYTAPLSSAGTRSALGLASANLDTQLAKLDTIDDFLDTEIAAIKAKTDNLPTDPADASDIAAAFGTVNSTLSTIAGYIDTEITALQTSVDDIPTNAELATALGTADDAVLTQIALVKAKTDSLTFTVAGQVDANIQYVNDVQVNGTGAPGSEWGP